MLDRTVEYTSQETEDGKYLITRLEWQESQDDYTEHPVGTFDSMEAARRHMLMSGCPEETRIRRVNGFPDSREWEKRIQAEPGQAEKTPSQLLVDAMFAFFEASLDAGGSLIVNRREDEIAFRAYNGWADKHQKALAHMNLAVRAIAEQEKANA